MAWTSPSTVTVGQVLTASFWNTQVRDNLNDLDRRTTPTGAVVATSETTTSTSYADLATSGPAVTVTIGSTGKALVMLYCSLANTGTTGAVAAGFAVSGASTVAAADASAISLTPSAAGTGGRQGVTFLVTGLTAGSNTFTMKYRTVSGTGQFVDRKIIVTPLGS